MRVLLTGGAGYIASHTAVALLDAGHDIEVLDDFSNSSEAAVHRVEVISQRKVPIHRVDLTNSAASAAVFSAGEFDSVVHFAGLKSVSESVSSPVKYYRTNIGSTLVLLQNMADFGVRRLVFSSSATVYGANAKLPARETDSVGSSVSNPYGRTKSMIEEILRDAATAEPELKVSILRYFNPVGAHFSGLIGDDPRQIPNNLFPYVAQVAAGVRDKVQVFGNQYATPDGTGVRDYVHVMDLAKGHTAALAMVQPGVDVYNLGTGRGTSVLEVIAAFSRAAGRPVPFEIVGARPGDVAESYADVSKARSELGWVAERTLDDACQDAWRWQSQNPKGYGADLTI